MTNVKVDQKCTIFSKIKRENYQIRVKQSFFYFLSKRIELSFFFEKKKYIFICRFAGMKFHHFLIFFLLSITFNVARAQYWMGVKVGPSLIMHDYRYETYKDSFNIDIGYNFHFGAIMTCASKRFAVTLIKL